MIANTDERLRRRAPGGDRPTAPSTAFRERLPETVDEQQRAPSAALSSLPGDRSPRRNSHNSEMTRSRLNGDRIRKTVDTLTELISAYTRIWRGHGEMGASYNGIFIYSGWVCTSRCMYDLTGFQRDLLYVIAGLDEPHGLAIKEELEDYYEKEIHHGRLYPNLDTLVEKGLVEKGQRDRRTNYYTLTRRGRREIDARTEWEAQYVDH